MIALSVYNIAHVCRLPLYKKTTITNPLFVSVGLSLSLVYLIPETIVNLSHNSINLLTHNRRTTTVNRNILFHTLGSNFYAAT